MSTTTGGEALPTDPRRVRAFASFFKNYMSVSSVVVAALPIPVTSMGALPTFADERLVLSTYTSLFCFLTLGFLFYMRHSFARGMFPDFAVLYRSKRSTRGSTFISIILRILPLLLIFASAGLAIAYHEGLDRAVLDLADTTAISRRDILAASHLYLPFAFWLRATYIGMFVCAEAAFILMAIREYLQDLLTLSDREVIQGERMDAA